MAAATPRMYGELAGWFHLLSSSAPVAGARFRPTRRGRPRPWLARDGEDAHVGRGSGGGTHTAG